MYRWLLIVFCCLFPATVWAQEANQAGNPHGTFSIAIDCSHCHTPSAWTPLRDTLAFNHDTATDFPLLGMHAETTCASCHENLRFDVPDTPPDACASCHVDVHQGTFDAACITCHTPTSFSDVDGLSIHVTTNFALEGAHEQLSCESCHTDDLGGAFAPLETTCIACHTSDYEEAQAIDHVGLGLPVDCEQCHNSLDWNDGLFDHASISNGFDLVGAHAVTSCASCHVLPSFDVLFQATDQDDCVACHEADYQDEHADDGFPTTCLTCHTTDTWSGTTFDHATLTNGFDLVGAHEALLCESCHVLPGLDLLFTPTDQDDCIACHEPDYQDEHSGDGFPTTCLTCHNTATWDGASFDHPTVANGFDLVGAHAPLLCESCHVSPDLDLIFTPASQDDCVACHEADYQDEHADDGFSTNCLTRHNTDDWEGFDHAVSANGFNLVGAHIPLDCSNCHVLPSLDLIFTPTDQDDCIACHEADYQDEHADDGFPTTCLTCHNTNDWDDAEDFDHAASANGFDLVGAHAPLLCESCHVLPGLDLIFNPVGQDDCIACHESDYQDEHAGDGFPTTCLTCHNTNDWDDAEDFNHESASNGFSLVGAHAPLDCSSCHVSPGLDLIFTPTDQDDCVACHEADYQDEHAGDGFPTTCLTCHNTNDWDDAEDFNHESASNGFDLVGSHNLIGCDNCHNTADLSLAFPAPNSQDDCATCHTVLDPMVHADDNYPATCELCHTADNWSSFDHASVSSGYDLVGSHEPLLCESCHVLPSLDLIFTPATQDDCVACHEADYQDEHADDGFPTTCLTCHNTNDWDDAEDFDHAASANGFDLVGAHAPLDCSSCHVSPGLDLIFSPATQDDCVACHEADYQDEHADDGFPTTCLTCHNTNDWDDAEDFDHAASANGFDLVGAHAPLDCSSCHVSPGLDLIFSPATQDDCVACHEADYQDEHADDGFPTMCLTCHTTDTWSGTTFDHATSANGFDLVGAHEALLCESCHVLPGLDLIFNPADQDDCLTCHESDYTTEHADDGFPTTCLTCHTTEVWTDFDHATVTNGYDLVGAHAPLDCSSCHTLPSLDLIFTPTDQDDCLTCHASDYNTEHADDGFPTTCLTCHTTDTWSGTTFDHATSANGYDLVGAHEALLCESCHVLPGLDLIFNPADQDDCLTCHESDFTTEHADDNYPTTCLTCHTTEVWTDFDHATVANGYDLVGAHEPLDCQSCHNLPSLDVLFTPTDQDDCVSCHASDYNTEHADDGFPTTCLTCHTTDTWSGTTFDHATASNGFDLVGAHEALLCESCHVLPGLDLIFNPADQDDCLTCHESDYTTEHADDNFPTTCLTCHTTEVWTDFDHATVTNGYDLVGAHEPLDCSSCHTLPSLDLIFRPTDQNDCFTCHESDYTSEHSDDGFPTMCLTCHTTDTWSGTTFDHATSANGFDLVGAHEALLCESCHVLPGLDLIFNPADQDDCLTCHESDYTTEHADDNFPTTCLTCHTTEVWTDFDHATVTNGYDLVGAHEPLACESCHTLPSLDVVFTPTDQDDCVACHASDYNTEHADDGFPTTCLTCHTTDTWSGTTFDHATSANGFDLVGAHEALLCESCHVLPGLDLIFNPADQDDCLTCHASDYNTEHADDGFPTTCLTCHTTEVWTDFDHATVTNGYDLVGAHEPLDCSSCHTLPSLDLIFTPTDQDDCVACHASDYNTEHADDGFPTTCLTCHTTETWSGTTFDHGASANGFDLVGAHEALLCESCHVLPGLDLIFNPADQDDCLTCHESDFTTEHADDNYPTTCLTCHTTEVWTDFDHATVTNGYDLVGAHEPLDCQSCHNLPSFDVLFTPTDQDDCVSCHASDYNTEHADDGFSDDVPDVSHDRYMVRHHL